MKLLYLVESGESKFLVFDEMPDKISTKYGDDTIIGRIGGIFYDFFAKRNERREAFGGRPMYRLTVTRSVWHMNR